MTDKELRDAAVVELKKTTQGYLKSNGQPRDLVGTQWKKGLDLLAQIGAVVEPPPPPPSPEPAPIAGQGYAKVFEENFVTFDPSVWKRSVWYEPEDPAAENYVKDGVLHLDCTRSSGYKGRHVCTVLGANNKGSWKQGYFESRMRWTGVKGAFPAFYLMSTNWRLTGNCNTLKLSELDIFEGFPGTGNQLAAHSGTLHRNTGGGCGLADAVNSNTWTGDAGFGNLGADWHVYAALWTLSEIVWYLDGREIKRAPAYSTTDQLMFMVLQMNSQHFQASEAPDASTPDILRTEVDWVRVWQKA